MSDTKCTHAETHPYRDYGAMQCNACGMVCEGKVWMDEKAYLAAYLAARKANWS